MLTLKPGMSRPTLNQVGQTSSLRATFKWKIPNFLSAGDDGQRIHDSPEFGFIDSKWRMMLYLEGYPIGKNKDYISIFLLLSDQEQMKVNFEISIVDNENKKFRKLSTKNENVTVKGCGWRNFIRRDKIFNNKDKLLSDGNLTILCKIKIDPANYIELSDSVKVANSSINSSGDFLNNGTPSDVKLIIGENVILAHKNILASKSRVFKLMFSQSLKENTLTKLNITEIDYEVIEEMLRFIYSGIVRNIKALAKDLLIVADKFAINGLKNLCEKSLCNDFSTENVIRYLLLADRYNAKELETQAIDFILANIKDLVSRPEFISVTNLHPGIELKIIRGIVAQK